MPRLIAALARHGIYEQPKGVPSAHLPHPLTPEGVEQSKKLGDHLQALCVRQGWDLHPVVDTSTLLRAWETGKEAAASWAGAPDAPARVEAFDVLAERSMGAAANLSMDEIARIVAVDPRYPDLVPGWKARSDHKLPFIGAESLLEAGARVARHIEARMKALENEIENDTLKVFVSHGGALRHAAVELGLLELGQVPALSMFYASAVIVERLGEGQWVHIEGEWKQRKHHKAAAAGD
jgi:2,3-bisphosphoglycerate-dependent phosphoglycerate mutase